MCPTLVLKAMKMHDIDVVYPTHHHLARYFRRTTGKTPLEYRRLCGQ